MKSVWRGPSALVAVLAAAVAAAVAAVAVAMALPTAAVPRFDALRAAHVPSDVPLLARDGSAIHSVRSRDHQRSGPWLALDEVSPALRSAIVLGEDRRFWQHGGVDMAALAAGAWARLLNERRRGASTLTMQLAALTDAELTRPAGGRGLWQKLMQMHRALQFESSWTKAQILEAYLNRVPLRGELVGVAAAAQQLFDKHASGLDAEEAALLAAMVRAPNAAPAQVERRACELLRLQQRSCQGLATTLALAMARRPGALPLAADENIAPHLALRQARTAVPGQALPSTLDARLQRLAQAALRRQLRELRGRNVEDGAIVVLDNASGDVLVWVGSSGPGLSAAPAVDAVLARRQPGSTLKPFVYALALQRRLLTAASLIDDAPLQLASAGALYRPQNYDHDYKGAVSARTALASSLNVPAVRVAAMLGPDEVFDAFVRAGLRPGESSGFHGHALALGSADVTLLDLTNAYRMLANGGRWSAARWAPGAPVEAARAVFDPAVAWLVGDMLADPAARATTFGLDSPLVTRGWAAVKTGTSKDLRDNWCIGYSQRHTVGVWVGNAGGGPMHGISGVSGAAPVWREIAMQLMTDAPSRPPTPPQGLVQARGEWFLSGTEDVPGPAPGKAALAPFGITSPRDGSVVVLDPDIPMAAQALVFEGAEGRWLVDGQAVGDGRRLRWQPRPGRHVLELRSAAPGAGQRIVFDVLAAPPPAPRRKTG